MSKARRQAITCEKQRKEVKFHQSLLDCKRYMQLFDGVARPFCLYFVCVNYSHSIMQIYGYIQY